MSLTKGVEVRVAPEQYTLLEQIPRVKGESVGALIRKAIDRQYVQPAREERIAAAQRLTSRNDDLGSWEEIKKRMNEEYTKDLDRETS